MCPVASQSDDSFALDAGPPNPLGLAGLEFVEFASRMPEELGHRFEQLGFKAIARHVSKAVTLYRQGDMNFLVNAEPDSFAARYAQIYGMGICALGMRVENASRALKRAIGLGAWPFEGERIGAFELKIPAIQGIGDSHIYFIDRWRGRGGSQGGVGDISIFDVDFRPIDIATAREDLTHAGTGLRCVDHMTQTVGAGRMQDWLDFYRTLLHFREIHEINPEGHIAQDSRVMVSPCGQVCIPLYEEGTARTEQMHAYLPDHPGEGVQHIALATDDIFKSIDALAANGLAFIEPPPAYYDGIDARLPGHGIDIDAMRARGILIDGEIGADGMPLLFLQAFVKRRPGEIFFEIVQRNGHRGFGEGNLRALASARSAAPAP